MELRRSTWGAAVRLAITLSVLGVAIAVLLHTIGLSQPVIVLGVILVGFTTSWIRTGHVAEQHATLHPARRPVTVAVRGVHSRVG